MTTAHIFTPKNDSLEERIRSCKSVLEAAQNLESSRSLTDDKEWSNRLGSQEEIQYAADIAQNSIKRASASIEYSELYYAKEQGLISIDDVKLLSDAKEKEKPEKSPDHGPSDDFEIDGPDFDM